MSNNIGMELLIQRVRHEFETEENINHYLFDDFVKSRRKYLKYVLKGTFIEEGQNETYILQKKRL